MARARKREHVLPAFLSLDNALAHLRKTGNELATSDWLLQFAAEGRLPLFAILRRAFLCESPSGLEPSQLFKQGEYIQLDADWARLILGHDGDDPVAVVAVWRSAKGLGHVCNVYSGKRDPLEICLDHLHVRSSDIEALAKGVEPSMDRPQGTRERQSMLAVIGALATAADIDLSMPSKAAEQIDLLTQKFGMRVSQRRIFDYLKWLEEERGTKAS